MLFADGNDNNEVDEKFELPKDDDPDAPPPLVYGAFSDGRRFDIIAAAISAPTAEHLAMPFSDFMSRLLISNEATEF